MKKHTPVLVLLSVVHFVLLDQKEMVSIDLVRDVSNAFPVSDLSAGNGN